MTLWRGKAAEKIKAFVKEHDVGFVFEVNVMAGLDPCPACHQDEQWAAWQSQIEDAIGIDGCEFEGGDVCHPEEMFRLRMWFLTSDPSSASIESGIDTVGKCGSSGS